MLKFVTLLNESQPYEKKNTNIQSMKVIKKIYELIYNI